MALFYKRFLRLAARWPKDEERLRSAERDASVFLKTELERVFRNQKTAFNNQLCEKRLKSLEQIVSHVHASEFPIKYKAGAMGTFMNGLRRMNSQHGRYIIGLESSPAAIGHKRRLDRLFDSAKMTLYRYGLIKKCPFDFPNLNVKLGSSKQSF